VRVEAQVQRGAVLDPLGVGRDALVLELVLQA
jgi:hypothetical protein